MASNEKNITVPTSRRVKPTTKLVAVFMSPNLALAILKKNPFNYLEDLKVREVSRSRNKFIRKIEKIFDNIFLGNQIAMDKLFKSMRIGDKKQNS